MHQLIEDMIVPAFGNTTLNNRHDAAVLPGDPSRMAFTTDSYTVHPLFFPGGDIGDLAINGTVNDLAMAGAKPLYLSVGFIIEEGLPMETLWRIVQSMKAAAEKANVQIVTGDTKVVDKGKGDGLYINTAGVGIIAHDQKISPRSVQKEDVIILNGDIARHGMAIMAVREGLEFESTIESDTDPLAEMVQSLLASDLEIHCLRDLTRGGLTSALNEIAEVAQLSIGIEQSAIPVREDVSAACEIFGFDPLYVANEGRFIAIVPANNAEEVLNTMKKHPLGKDAAVIGKVLTDSAGIVTMKTNIGIERVVDMMSGEQLPRIC